MKRNNWVILLCLLALPMAAQGQGMPNLCMDGTLLFREDFGGNDPSDPAVSRTPVPGMSSGYQQIYKLQTSDPGRDMGAGCYLVAKRGYRNSTNSTYSVWHIMDDHTYPGDTTRGYLLEIDGRGSGSDVFFSTTMSGLCAGSRLTFSAYVANLTTAGQYEGWKNNRPYVFPNLSFVITNVSTGAEIARYETGDIDHDYENYPKTWRESANWQLVGMNFIVPEGTNEVQLSIRNNASGSSTGNDFAIDDIEVHFCYPEGEIEGPNEVCPGSSAQLEASWEATGDMVEPLEFKWWHSLDSITWEEISGVSTFRLTVPAVQISDTGWYKAAMAEEGNIGSVNCRTMTKPFKLTLKDCGPPEPELCIDGILLFREDFGGNDPNDSRVGQTPVHGMTYNQLFDDYFGIMRSGSYLVTKQGYCNGDTSINNLPQNRGSQWHLQDDHTYPNDVTRGYLLEIDGRGDNSAFYTTTIEGLCEGIELTFSAYVANVMTWGQYVGSPGRYAYPRLKFVLTNPSNNTELATYDTGEIPFDSAFIGDYKCWQQSVEWRLIGMNFTVPNGVDRIQLTIYNNTTSYTGNDFAIDDIEIHLCMIPDTIKKDTIVCDTIPQIYWRDSLYNIVDTLRDTLRSNCGFDSIYYILHVETERCCPDLLTITADTTVCDTLMPFTWRDTLFTEAARYEIVYKDVRGCDSVLRVLTLNTKSCCPDVVEFSYDTLVCDTLLPFTWVIDDHTFVFTQAESQQLDIPHAKWTDCTGTSYIVRLDTVHCNRLYPLIVNKYNWQLLCHNVRVRELFPTLTPTAYQWYKNGDIIPNATEDDYSEHNELQGAFQLRLLMNDGTYVWSEILTIKPAETVAPSRITVYNQYGQLFYHAEGEAAVPQLLGGLYIICREHNGETIIEKRLIP